MNRPTKLYYLRQYESEDQSETNEDEIKIEVLTSNYYFSGFPKFSSDYKYLSFICSPELFHSHMTWFELRVFKHFWKPEEQEYWVVKRDYEPNDFFTGLYTYEDDYLDTQFVKGTSIILIWTLNKGCGLLWAINVDTWDISVLNNPNSNTNDWIELFNISEDCAFVHSSSNK